MEPLNTLNPSMLNGKVLVIDDEPSNRNLLEAFLGKQGYAVTTAGGGQEGLELAHSASPDVILLDVMMPSIDGFEVCRRIKRDPRLVRVPTILVTALTDRKDRHTGIAAGADEFLSKPLDLQEVGLRVKNALRQKRAFDALEDSYTRLKNLEQLRDNLIHMVVHDLKSPLVCISGNLELWKLHANREERASDSARYVDAAMDQTMRMVTMVSDLLDIRRMEENKLPLNLRRADLRALVQDAVKMASGAVPDRGVTCSFGDDQLPVYADGELMVRVMNNLLVNGLKFTRSGEVRVSVKAIDQGYEVRVSDDGPGIDPRHHDRIFEVFFQVEDREHMKIPSTGLGLSFCKLAIEAHEGRIGVESEPGKGSTFWFSIPSRLGMEQYQSTEPDCMIL